MFGEADELFGGRPRADMSPMIDLVFLILIFFMIVSTTITYNKDKNVEIPIAYDGAVPRSVEGRIVINVYQDGTVYDEDSNPLTLTELESLIGNAFRLNPDTQLQLRADARVKHSKVEDVIEASAKGGITRVIFSTYLTGN